MKTTEDVRTRYLADVLHNQESVNSACRSLMDSFYIHHGQMLRQLDILIGYLQAFYTECKKRDVEQLRIEEERKRRAAKKKKKGDEEEKEEEHQDAGGEETEAAEKAQE